MENVLIDADELELLLRRDANAEIVTTTAAGITIMQRLDAVIAGDIFRRALNYRGCRTRQRRPFKGRRRC